MHLAVAGALLVPHATRERTLAAPAMLVELRSSPRAPVPDTIIAPHAVRLRDAPAVNPLPVSLPPIDVAPALAAAIAMVPAASESAARESEPAAVPAAVEPPRFDAAYLRNPAPAYPPLSRRIREHGRVVLRVLVSAAGHAEDVEVDSSSGSERLDRAAIDAVRRWQFAPAHRGAQAIAAWALVPIVFHLDS